MDPRVLTAQTAPWRRCSEIATCSFAVGGPFGRGQSRVEAESGRPPSPQGPGPHRVAGPAAQCQEPGRQLRELGACVSSGGAVPGPARACRRRAVLQGGGAGPEPAGFVTLQTAGRGAEWAEDFATVLVSRQKCVSLRPGEGHRQTDRLLLLTSAQVGAARRPGQGGPTVGRRPRASPRRHPWPCAGSQEARRGGPYTGGQGLSIPHSRSAESLALTPSKPPRVAKPASSPPPPQPC